jgi:hypothetical protein
VNENEPADRLRKALMRDPCFGLVGDAMEPTGDPVDVLDEALWAERFATIDEIRSTLAEMRTAIDVGVEP